MGRPTPEEALRGTVPLQKTLSPPTGHCATPLGSDTSNIAGMPSRHRPGAVRRAVLVCVAGPRPAVKEMGLCEQ